MSKAHEQRNDQRYELVSTLGRGGMAEVYLGWMNSIGGLRRKVAIKRILPELARKQSKLFQQMFVDEARLAFQLEHDNIVRVYDVGQTSNTFFIVMEYIEGMDLKTINERMIERNMPYPVGIVLYVMLQVCAGLGYAHALKDDSGKPLGLIHNDISPPNILIGRYGEVKVADFGLSDAVSNSVSTPEGMIKGKFAYISPEGTTAPIKITPKSDIFSLGIVMWEMLAGRRLFHRETDLETFKAVKECVIADIRRIRPELPEDLVSIVHKALSKNPDNRYQTTEQMYLDIASFATAYNIPVNRYDLCWLVDDLADNKWTGFAGQRVTQDMVKGLQEELGGMLPPGDAIMLNGFVTGMSETEDAQNLVSNTGESDWVNDVFDDLGLPKERSKLTKVDAKSDSSTTPVKAADPTLIRNTAETSKNKRVEISGLLPSARAENRFSSRRIPAAKRRKNANIPLVLTALLVGVLIGYGVGLLF